MTSFGKDLIESAREAVAISEGKLKPLRHMAVDAVDVAALRKRLNLSQDKFSKKFGLSAATKVIAQRPEAVIAALKA